MRQFKRWFLIVILVLVPACGLLLEEGRDVVAEVGGDPIRLRDLMKEIRKLPFDERARTNDADASVRLNARRNVLNNMINERVLTKEAEARGVRVSDEEVNAVFEREEAHDEAVGALIEGMENTGAGHEHAGEGGHTRQEMREMRGKLMVEKLLLEMELSDAALLKYYEEHINEFRVPIPLVSYEIAQVDAAGETTIIDKLYQKAFTDGTTLGEALASMEDVPQNVFVTTTPLTSLFHFVPEMKIRMGPLQKGEMAEPFQVNINEREQYVAVRVVESTDTVPFDNIKEQLRSGLSKNYIEGLRSHYKVVIHEEILNYQVPR